MNQQTNAKKEYAAVDIAKFFFCICILFRHTGAYHEIPYSWYFQHGIFCLAVPFFFVASGYFFGCKIFNQDGQSLWSKVKSYEKRLLYPYAVFSLINSALAAISLYCGGESVLWTLLRLARAAVFYPYGALWYIWASMTGMLLLYWFIKHNRLRLAVLIGIVAYGFALLGNSYYFLLENTSLQKIMDLYLKITTSARNGLFVGFPLLGIGIVLGKYHERLHQKKARIAACVILVVSFVFLFGEIILIKDKTVADDHSLFVSQLTLIPALLILLLNFRWQGQKELMLMLRKLSTGIYFIHRPVLTCLTYLLAYAGLTDLSRITQFFILLFLCAGICYPVYKYKKEPLYSLLK